MIPQKLQLKNFLSYGPIFQTIDFGSHNLICLSGKNGHGKSALLDAITWAIWGQARKISGTSKPDSQLLRLGQTHMVVIFDFYFNNLNYRIRREYSETYNKPYAALDFATIDPDTQKAIPLTEKTIRDTQAKIESVLGLDFDSFVNSAFLRQGQANEFSKKSPQERKNILANILNLQQYETIRKLAVEKNKQTSIDLQITKQNSEQLSQELTAHATVNTQLQELNKELLKIDEETQGAQTEIANFTQQKKELEKELHQKNLLQFQQLQITKKIDEQKQLITTQYHHWHAVNRQLRKTCDYGAIEKEKEQLIRIINEMQQQLQRHLHIKETYLKAKEAEHQLLKQLSDAHSLVLQEQSLMVERTSMEKKLLHQTHEQLNEQIKTTKENLFVLSNHLKEQKNVENYFEHDAFEKQFEKRKAYYQLWVARIQTWNKELAELNSKKDMVQTTTNPCCPLCEQNLSASRKRFLKIKFIKLKQSYQQRIHRLTEIIKKLKELLIEQHEQLTNIRQKKEEAGKKIVLMQEYLKQYEKLTQVLSEQEQAFEKNKQALHLNEQTKKKQDDEYQSIKDNFTTIVSTNTQLTTLKQTIIEYEEELRRTVVNNEEYQRLVNRLAILDKEKELYLKLLQEKEQQHLRYNHIKDLCKQLRIVKKEQISIDIQLIEFAEVQKKYEAADKQLAICNHAISQLQEKKGSILIEKGKLEQTKQICLKNEQQLKQLQQKSHQLQQLIDDYQAIAVALGKDGIQALLIEEALPEIEQEANILLAQLTNNQAHIFIDSLRDLKKGGSKETLDIKISDNMGIRPYELFSGGEAFRIDFALRIAISKLLARRAGTSLQTLIIDEGFGSQDEEGIAHLMDAIHKIQDNFAKVIIVSHLPILKEQFPVHFLIEKGPQGSSVRVIEH